VNPIWPKKESLDWVGLDEMVVEWRVLGRADAWLSMPASKVQVR
jgi:hypothetical protein